MRGKDRVVMYYDFNFTDGYVDGLGEVTFINKWNGKLIEKDYYKKLSSVLSSGYPKEF